MAYQPLIFSGFTTGSGGGGGGGSTSYKNPVATEASLPAGTDGDVIVTLDTDYIWVYDGTTSRWINTGIKSAIFGSTPNTSGYSLTYTNVSTDRRELRLTLQPADATNPGGVSTGTQTFGGNKTFSGTVAASNISGTNTGDVTLGAFGSTPSANGASLSGQVLTLQPADNTHPGEVSTGTQTFGGSKTFSSLLNADGGIDRSTSGTLTIGATNSNIIDIGNPGATVNIQDNLTVVNEITSPVYNSATPNNAVNGVIRLSNSDFITWRNGSNTSDIGFSLGSDDIFTFDSAIRTNVSFIVQDGGSGNEITIQAPSLSADYSLTLPDTNGDPNQALITNGSGVTSWVSVPFSVTGDLNQTSFTAADNQVAPANVTGLAFSNAAVRSFEVHMSIVRNNIYALYKLYGIQKAASWEMSQDYTGDVTGLAFTVTTAGQVQYTSSSTGFTATLKFRAIVTGP